MTGIGVMMCRWADPVPCLATVHGRATDAAMDAAWLAHLERVHVHDGDLATVPFELVERSGEVLDRPHERAASEQLDIECRDLADELVKIAHEDGHAHMIASVLRALVLRIAESGDPSKDSVS